MKASPAPTTTTAASSARPMSTSRSCCARSKKLSRQRLPVVAEGGATLGHLVVSVQCLAAMRFASAKLTPSGGSTPLGMDVRVEDVSLAAPAMLRLDDLLSSRRVRVDVDMPPGVCAKPLSSKPVKIAKGKGHFKFAGTVGIEPGSSGHNALLSALEVASKAREKKAIRGREQTGAARQTRQKTKRMPQLRRRRRCSSRSSQ